LKACYALLPLHVGSVARTDTAGWFDRAGSRAGTADTANKIRHSVASVGGRFVVVLPDSCLPTLEVAAQGGVALVVDSAAGR